MTAKKTSRLGVGASTPTSTNNLQSVDWTTTGKKKILSVGKKKRGHGDDDDEDSAVLVGDYGLDRDDDNGDEDEGGRTSVVSERKRKVSRKNAAAAAPSAIAVDEGVPPSSEANGSKEKRKKKKGKKERVAERDSTASGALEDADNAPAEENNINESNQKVENGSNQPMTALTEVPNKNNNKRKRKKIRSRQKNIRKDTRAANDKPSHLVLGRSDYAGRPLTKATREILKTKNTNDDIGGEENNWTKGNWTSGDVAAGGESGDKGESISGSGEPATKNNDSVTQVKNSNIGQPDDNKKVESMKRISSNQDDGQPLNDNISRKDDEIKAVNAGNDKRKKKKRKFKNLSL